MNTERAWIVRDDDDEDDELEDGAVVPARRVVTIPLMLMDHAPAPVDPREVAYLERKARLATAYLGDKAASGFGGTCPSCGYHRPLTPAPAVVPRRDDQFARARITAADVAQAQQRRDEAYREYVDRISNAWKEGRGL